MRFGKVGRIAQIADVSSDESIDIRDEADPDVCEAQVAARSVFEGFQEAARQGATLEDLAGAMMGNFDEAGKERIRARLAAIQERDRQAEARSDTRPES
jgi:hypothetical protein